MSQSKVLICADPKEGVIWSKEEQKSQLEAVAEVIELSSSDRESFLKDCQPGGKYDGVVAIYRHGASASAVGNFDKELIDALPKSVKYVCHNGAGYDTVDVDACTARGIQVSHTPGSVDDATATVGIYLALSAMRQFHVAELNVRAGKFKQGLQPARDPEGKTVGIIGMGGIGKTMAKRFLAFDMKILYHNRRPISPEPSFPCTYCENVDDLLAQSDIVSLNLPLNEKTKGSFGKAQFDKMKDGSVLVNTARGGVVDEDALIEALESGKLFSAGLDVFPDEPNVNPKLIAMKNITLLPHMGTETRDSQKKMELQVFDNIVSALQGKGLPNQVPEQRK
ncbi:putative 2-hydroxyacid dehydrogenase [Kockovaella imperatae]|uniref:Putative 2-hydroxyacid dehydrogenase n=1 Tax=Kockovaella imperatae TaxID=4999 RepID=A0A1Y1UU54_9TREE|nr:putative 2-hydroxyacid dehydrogenase [Kockovaella imperatae]ORX40956.1 putative 2-hydroxyacid dehydrogenase [Kockovaella imperatae]